MFTLIYNDGSERRLNGDDNTSLQNKKRWALQIAKKNQLVMAVRYENRDREIIWEREAPAE